MSCNSTTANTNHGGGGGGGGNNDNHNNGNGLATSSQACLQSVEERILTLRAKLHDPQQNLSKEDILRTITEFQPLYKKLIIEDIDSAVQRQFDIFLWNDCFKKPLTYFLKVDKHIFNIIIESGVGFYLSFIQDAGLQFDVSFVKNSVRSMGNPLTKMRSVVRCTPSKAAVYYILQSCMVHVADLLRYGGNFGEALKMYDKSTSVSPAHGQPYHQMGMLQQVMDTKSVDSTLTSLYCFARAVCTATPYLQAHKNLEELLVKSRGFAENPPESYEEKLMLSFIEIVDSLVMNTTTTTENPLPKFIAAFQPESRAVFPIESLTFAQVFRMVVISLWVYKRECDKKSLGMENNNEGRALALIASLMSIILQTGSWREIRDITTFIALAHLNILLQWIKIHPYVLANPMFRTNLNSFYLCDVADRVIRYGDDYMSTAKELHYVILPEEKKLLGFLPLQKSYDELQSVMEETDRRGVALRVMRFIRLVEDISIHKIGTLGLVRRFNFNYFVVPFSGQGSPREMAFGSYQRQLTPIDDVFKMLLDEIEKEELEKKFQQQQEQQKLEPRKPGLLSSALAKKLASEAQESGQSLPTFDQWMATPASEEIKTTTGSSPAITFNLMPAQSMTPVANASTVAVRLTAPTPKLSPISSTDSLYGDYSLLFDSIWTPNEKEKDEFKKMTPKRVQEAKMKPEQLEFEQYENDYEPIPREAITFASLFWKS